MRPLTAAACEEHSNRLLLRVHRRNTISTNRIDLIESGTASGHIYASPSLERQVQSGRTPMLAAELVDILCLGSGGVGMAAGIAGADAGLEVLVAEYRQERTAPIQAVDAAVGSWTTLLQRRWGVEESNSTAAYIDELTNSLGPPVPVEPSDRIPTDTVETFDGLNFGRTEAVPPFHGTQLAAWSRECLASPLSLIVSRLDTWPLTPMRTVDGPTIAAALIASLPTTRRRKMTVRQWLSELAREKGVAVYEACWVEELLFKGGHPMGAVLGSRARTRTVLARRGVVFGTSSSDGHAELPMSTGDDTALCVVGRIASRFARLEFLVDASSHGIDETRGRLA